MLLTNDPDNANAMYKKKTDRLASGQTATGGQKRQRRSHGGEVGTVHDFAAPTFRHDEACLNQGVQVMCAAFDAPCLWQKLSISFWKTERAWRSWSGAVPLSIWLVNKSKTRNPSGLLGAFVKNASHNSRRRNYLSVRSRLLRNSCALDPVVNEDKESAAISLILEPSVG